MLTHHTTDTGNRYGWNGQVMRFGRLPKKMKKVVRELLNKGLMHIQYETTECIHDVAWSFDIQCADVVACMNYIFDLMERANLYGDY